MIDTAHAQTPYRRAMNIWARYTRQDDFSYSDGEAHRQDVNEFMRAALAINVRVNVLPWHLSWAVHKGAVSARTGTSRIWCWKIHFRRQKTFCCQT